MTLKDTEGTKDRDGAPGSQRGRILRMAAAIAAVWTLIVGASLAWNWSVEEDWILEVARIEAESNLNKDRALRQWMASLGGLYAPLGARVQPTPYLAHMPERDLRLADGRMLTMIDPATAIKKIGSAFAELYGTRVRIVGHHHWYNPENAPDAWEAKALEAFTLGAREVAEIVAGKDGKSYLQMMRPMHMGPGCIRCHEPWGVKEGELRGATGVVIPLEHYRELAEEEFAVMIGTHGGIWLLGIGLIGFATGRGLRGDAERTLRENALRQFSLAVEQSASGIVITGVDSRIEYVNPRYCQITGYTAAELDRKSVV